MRATLAFEMKVRKKNSPGKNMTSSTSVRRHQPMWSICVYERQRQTEGAGVWGQKTSPGPHARLSTTFSPVALKGLPLSCSWFESFTSPLPPSVHFCLPDCLDLEWLSQGKDQFWKRYGWPEAMPLWKRKPPPALHLSLWKVTEHQANEPSKGIFLWSFTCCVSEGFYSSWSESW